MALVPNTPETFWAALAAVREAVTSKGGKKVPAPKVSADLDKDVFITGMQWFRYQAYYDGERVRRLQPPVARLALLQPPLQREVGCGERTNTHARTGTRFGGTHSTEGGSTFTPSGAAS